MCERLRSRLFLQLPQGSMTLRFCPSKFTTHCPSRVHKDHSGSQFAASQVKLKGGGACETRVLPESPCSALVPRSPLTRPPRKTRGSSFRKGWAQRERRTCAIMPPPAVPAHHGDAPPRAALRPCSPLCLRLPSTHSLHLLFQTPLRPARPTSSVALLRHNARASPPPPAPTCLPWVLPGPLFLCPVWCLLSPPLLPAPALSYFSPGRASHHSRSLHSSQTQTMVCFSLFAFFRIVYKGKYRLVCIFLS